MNGRFVRPIFGFNLALLRGVSQVVLQNNALSGLLILIGIAINSWLAAYEFLIGGAIATLVAMWFKADESDIRDGKFCFSGGYVGLLVGSFTSPEFETPVRELLFYLFMGGILAVPVTSGLNFALKKLDLSALSLPIIVLFWALLASVYYTDLPSHTSAPQLLASSTEAPDYTWQTPLHGIANALAQIFIQANPLTGLFVFLGILVNSRIAALMAVLGGLFSIAVSLFFLHPESTIRDGVMAFNPVLTAMALGGLFLHFNWHAIVYALMGALLSMWLFVALSAVLVPLGLPAVTLPFVLSVWILMLGSERYEFVSRIPLKDVSRPEEHVLPSRA